MRRKLANAFLDLSGVSALRWRSRPAGVYCFNFHRIGNDDGSEFHPNLFSCTRARFAEIIAFLKREFEVIGLEELVAMVTSGAQPPSPLALITFDDGYADNFDAAYPELLAAGCPALFFLPTDFIDGGELPWWDRIAWRVAAIGDGRMEVPGASEPVRLSADDLVGSIRRVLRAVKDSSMVPMEEKVRVIEQQGPASHFDGAGRRMFMSWEQILEMQAGGMAFGSHTRSHRILSHLSLEDQRAELLGSREIIEKRLGRAVTALAYPVGGESTYTCDTVRIARDCGYQIAFNYIKGVNVRPSDNQFELRRIEVSDNPSSLDLRRRVLSVPRV